MRFILYSACATAFLLQLRAFAEPTPLTQPLAEEKEITITCELSKSEPHASIPVFGSSKDSEKAKGTYHYKLWLPKGYLADTQRRWPCIFIASPGGHAGFETLGERLKKGGYVVALLVESKNGPWEPIVGNFLAAHDDLVQRVRIQEGLKFATGFSGGARASSVFAQVRPGFAGLILQGAGAFQDDKKALGAFRSPPGFLVAMSMGEKDSNKSEVAAVKAALPASARFLALPFDGGHQWAPPPVIDEALTWIEQQIYVEGPARPELKPVYLSYFKQQQAAYVALSTPWERYQAANRLLELARARGLAADPVVAPQLREAQADAVKLRADPAIAREAMAADALRRLQDSQRGASPQKVATDLAEFTKRYPGTEAAKKAAELSAEGK